MWWRRRLVGIGDAFELRANPIDRPRDALEFLLDALRACFELRDIAADGAKPVDEHVDNNFEIFDATDALRTNVRGKRARALCCIDRQCVQLGDAMINARPLVRIECSSDRSFDPRWQDRPQISRDLLDLVDLGGQVGLVLWGVVGHARSSGTVSAANEGWPAPGRG